MLEILDWTTADQRRRRKMLARPVAATADPDAVAAILSRVRAEGDAALRRLTAELDGVDLASFRVTEDEFRAAEAGLDEDVREAMAFAAANLERFHRAVLPTEKEVVVQLGVVCRQRWRPLRSVGLYVPAGTAPLPSTALMLGLPARMAGCPERILCSPPRPDGSADPAVLAAARLAGVEQVFKLGGAQAIAAMAYGTASVPRVDKIFGPGNPWVTEAKRQVAGEAGGAAVDLPAGPSEVMVVADATGGAEPAWIAADLLSQAEHGPDSQVILVTWDAGVIAAVREELRVQLESLPRADVARRALAASRAVIVDDPAMALAVVETYAPEHLILACTDAQDLADRVSRAGSVFVGPWAPETIGDYVSGTNHVLPTAGHAAAYGALSTVDFMRAQTEQRLDREGLARIGPAAVTLARQEGLEAHARAVECRLDADPAALPARETGS